MKLIMHLVLSIFAISYCTASFAGADLLSAKKKTLEGEITAIDTRCAAGTCNQKDVENLEKKKSDLESLQDAFEFGVAIGFENYKSKYISKVETVGDTRVVRVSDSQRYKPSVWLETHYVWDGTGSKWNFTHSAPGFYVGARILGADSEAFDGKRSITHTLTL